MLRQLERLRRAAWIIKQPLSRKPRLPGTPVSDLFVWRNSSDWSTFFELTDINGLFGDTTPHSGRYVTLFFFDKNGKRLFDRRVNLSGKQRQTIDISALLSEVFDSFGTFSVFHSVTPQVVSEQGSFIAERGYVSYRYKGAPLRTYVHGNLDAIALGPDKTLEMLGSSGILSREYRLQHELSGPARYEIGMVNSSAFGLRLACKVFSSRNGETLDIQKARLSPRELHVFTIEVAQSQTARIVINSRLVMARPLVFHIHNQKLDVFHG